MSINIKFHLSEGANAIWDMLIVMKGAWKVQLAGTVEKGLMEFYPHPIISTSVLHNLP